MFTYLFRSLSKLSIYYIFVLSAYCLICIEKVHGLDQPAGKAPLTHVVVVHIVYPACKSVFFSSPWQEFSVG